MILISTLRKLQDKNALVFVVEHPAWTLPANTVGTHEAKPIAATREIYATKAAAHKGCGMWDEINDSIGGPRGTIATVPARSLDLWTCLPVEASK